MFVNVYYFHVCFYNPSANCFGSNQLVHSHTHRAGPCILSLHLCNLSQHSFVVGTCGVAIKSGWCIPLLSVPGNVGTTVELSVFTPWACIEYGLVAMFLKTIFTLSPTSAWIWGPEWSERKISYCFGISVLMIKAKPGNFSLWRMESSFPPRALSCYNPWFISGPEEVHKNTR